jgi:DNA-binding SARP family transcriptional activator
MRLRILGGLGLTTADGAEMPGVTRQTRLLLVCLALAGTKGLTRAELCALFWPDRPSAQARNSLRQSLATIRKVLAGEDRNVGEMSILSDLDVVRLSADPAAVDVHAFPKGLKCDGHDGLVAAAHAYQGELLAGFDLSDHVEQFVSSHWRSLADEAQRLAERLSTSDGGGVEALDAVQALAERLLTFEPASEEAHRTLMRIYLQRGRTNAALRQFELCKEALLRELQAEPDVETRRLASSIHSSGRDEQRVRLRVEGRSTIAIRDAPISRGAKPSVAIMPFDNLGHASDE